MVIILSSSCHPVIITLASSSSHVSIMSKHHAALRFLPRNLANPVATSGCVIIVELSCHQRVMVLTSSCGHLVIMLSASSHVNSMPHGNIMSSRYQHVLFMVIIVR
eukprot:6489905-Amphidinium_carterae.1